nr:hypothetical protein [Tanacetum cinerariifolium]
MPPQCHVTVFEVFFATSMPTALTLVDAWLGLCLGAVLLGVKAAGSGVEYSTKVKSDLLIAREEIAAASKTEEKKEDEKKTKKRRKESQILLSQEDLKKYDRETRIHRRPITHISHQLSFAQDTPLVSPFLDSDDDSDDGEVWNEKKNMHAQPKDLNELFQKLLEDLKELAEYVNSPSRNRSNFLNDNKDHSENSSNEIAASSSNQEKEGPPQDSDIRHLIREECCIEVSEEQKQNMEDTILELVKIYRQKEILCMHHNVDDLVESDLNSKLLSMNSQRLNKEKQEVKNIVKQPAERRTCIKKSLQNFRVIHKSSISLKNTSQISPVHAVAPILSTKEPEYSSSIGFFGASIFSDEISGSHTEPRATTTPADTTPPPLHHRRCPLHPATTTTTTPPLSPTARKAEKLRGPDEIRDQEISPDVKQG